MVDLQSKKHWNKRALESYATLERNKQAVIALYNQGLCYDEISRELQISSGPTISKYLHLWGVRRSKQEGLKVTHSKTKGRVFSVEEKRKLSEAIKRSYDKNPELRKARSESNKRHWNSMTKEERGRRCANGLKVMQLHAQQTNISSIELKVKSQLEEIGIRFVRQKQICNGKFILDFYIPSLKLVIECNGDYWHNLPDRRLRDEKLKNYVEATGRNIIFIWEHEINDDWFWVGDYISKEVGDNVF